MKIEIWTLLCCLLPAGCGGNDIHDVTCQEVGDRLCEMATDCSGGTTCVMAFGSDTGLKGTAEHESLVDCQNFFSLLRCSDSTFDFNGCNEGLGTAQCVDTSKGKGLDLPAACW